MINFAIIKNNISIKRIKMTQKKLKIRRMEKEIKKWGNNRS